MIKNGLNPISPHRKDYSFIPTFGGTTNGLPDDFSIYSGETIPNQNTFDTRFNPSLPPLPYGCTGESTTFLAGLEDSATYDPADFYFATPPGDNGGRDIRVALTTAIDRGFRTAHGLVGARRTAYFNVYGAGAIDDFDAARIAIWINQSEKRAVSVGTYWYPAFAYPVNGILPYPSFNTKEATMHNWIVTGWKTINGTLYLEGLSWQGEDYGNMGVCYVSREIYNALLQQPWTGAFTITKTTSTTPVPIGMTAYIDHLVYFIRSLFHL